MGPNYVLDKGFYPSAAVAQFTAVVLTGTETVAPATSAGGPVLGVCQDTISAADATNGRAADVRIMGISRMVCGAGCCQRVHRRPPYSVRRVQYGRELKGI